MFSNVYFTVHKKEPPKQVILSYEERLSFRRKQIDRAYAALLLEVVTETGDNKAKAASLPGVSRRTFYRMLEKYPIKP